MARPEQVMALYRCHFPSFLRFAFHELHAGQSPIQTPYIDILADHLARAASGEITRLIVNMPPRTLKSLSASIALPVWMLGRDPNMQIISVAGTHGHANNLAATARELMTAPRCRALYPHMNIEEQRGDILLPHGGQRFSATVGGKLPRRDVDLVVVDDPVIPAQIHDAAKLKAISNWFQAEVLQRLNDQRIGAAIIVTRRLHVDDLCGHLLRGKGSWVHLNLPAIATEDELWELSGGRTVVRRQGEALAPALADKQQLYEHMLRIGAYRFRAEFQQAPFETMHEDERRCGSFGGREDDPNSSPVWLGSVPESDIMAYEIFGIGTCHPAPPPRHFTLEDGPLPIEDVEDD